ncbi:uncharacterized protein BBOV_IV000890 [Babesia bovis T2Bo]|uniref:Uncharacterized protein n=1 Tax=Babesia bovis TaxID=5865 RepID=A7AV61_BABBO|nr:uncharacterized protein BBOV_IV000890 [Babesia bovis T2Bo]EDO05687.1 hypothetical protein BBOV_IV000890 [Babesia bovis T2Bo]|eukprot:XP_001609255.1 hypothetical protein [Babesia bovis T2Bo]
MEMNDSNEHSESIDPVTPQGDTGTVPECSSDIIHDSNNEVDVCSDDMLSCSSRDSFGEMNQDANIPQPVESRHSQGIQSECCLMQSSELPSCPGGTNMPPDIEMTGVDSPQEAGVSVKSDSTESEDSVNPVANESFVSNSQSSLADALVQSVEHMGSDSTCENSCTSSQPEVMDIIPKEDIPDSSHPLSSDADRNMALQPMDVLGSGNDNCVTLYDNMELCNDVSNERNPSTGSTQGSVEQEDHNSEQSQEIPVGLVTSFGDNSGSAESTIDPISERSMDSSVPADGSTTVSTMSANGDVVVGTLPYSDDGCHCAGVPMQEPRASFSFGTGNAESNLGYSHIPTFIPPPDAGYFQRATDQTTPPGSNRYSFGDMSTTLSTGMNPAEAWFTHQPSANDLLRAERHTQEPTFSSPARIRTHGEIVEDVGQTMESHISMRNMESNDTGRWTQQCRVRSTHHSTERIPRAGENVQHYSSNEVDYTCYCGDYSINDPGNSNIATKDLCNELYKSGSQYNSNEYGLMCNPGHMDIANGSGIVNNDEEEEGSIFLIPDNFNPYRPNIDTRGLVHPSEFDCHSNICKGDHHTKEYPVAEDMNASDTLNFTFSHCDASKIGMDDNKDENIETSDNFSFCQFDAIDASERMARSRSTTERHMEVDLTDINPDVQPMSFSERVQLLVSGDLGSRTDDAQGYHSPIHNSVVSTRPIGGDNDMKTVPISEAIYKEITDRTMKLLTPQRDDESPGLSKLTGLVESVDRYLSRVSGTLTPGIFSRDPDKSPKVPTASNQDAREVGIENNEEQLLGFHSSLFLHQSVRSQYNCGSQQFLEYVERMKKRAKFESRPTLSAEDTANFKKRVESLRGIYWKKVGQYLHKAVMLHLGKMVAASPALFNKSGAHIKLISEAKAILNTFVQRCNTVKTLKEKVYSCLSECTREFPHIERNRMAYCMIYKESERLERMLQKREDFLSYQRKIHETKLEKLRLLQQEAISLEERANNVEMYRNNVKRYVSAKDSLYNAYAATGIKVVPMHSSMPQVRWCVVVFYNSEVNTNRIVRRYKRSWKNDLVNAASGYIDATLQNEIAYHRIKLEQRFNPEVDMLVYLRCDDNNNGSDTHGFTRSVMHLGEDDSPEYHEFKQTPQPRGHKATFRSNELPSGSPEIGATALYRDISGLHSLDSQSKRDIDFLDPDSPVPIFETPNSGVEVNWADTMDIDAVSRGLRVFFTAPSVRWGGSAAAVWEAALAQLLTAANKRVDRLTSRLISDRMSDRQPITLIELLREVMDYGSALSARIRIVQRELLGFLSHCSSPEIRCSENLMVIEAVFTPQDLKKTSMRCTLEIDAHELLQKVSYANAALSIKIQVMQPGEQQLEDDINKHIAEASRDKTIYDIIACACEHSGIPLHQHD